MKRLGTNAVVALFECYPISTPRGQQFSEQCIPITICSWSLTVPTVTWSTFSVPRTDQRGGDVSGSNEHNHVTSQKLCSASLRDFGRTNICTVRKQHRLAGLFKTVCSSTGRSTHHHSVCVALWKSRTLWWFVQNIFTTIRVKTKAETLGCKG